MNPGPMLKDLDETVRESELKGAVEALRKAIEKDQFRGSGWGMVEELLKGHTFTDDEKTHFLEQVRLMLKKWGTGEHGKYTVASIIKACLEDDANKLDLATLGEYVKEGTNTINKSGTAVGTVRGTNELLLWLRNYRETDMASYVKKSSEEVAEIEPSTTQGVRELRISPIEHHTEPTAENGGGVRAEEMLSPRGIIWRTQRPATGWDAYEEALEIYKDRFNGLDAKEQQEVVDKLSAVERNGPAAMRLEAKSCLYPPPPPPVVAKPAVKPAQEAVVEQTNEALNDFNAMSLNEQINELAGIDAIRPVHKRRWYTLGIVKSKKFNYKRTLRKIDEQNGIETELGGEKVRITRDGEKLKAELVEPQSRAAPRAEPAARQQPEVATPRTAAAARQELNISDLGVDSASVVEEFNGMGAHERAKFAAYFNSKDKQWREKFAESIYSLSDSVEGVEDTGDLLAKLGNGDANVRQAVDRELGQPAEEAAEPVAGPTEVQAMRAEQIDQELDLTAPPLEEGREQTAGAPVEEGELVLEGADWDLSGDGAYNLELLNVKLAAMKDAGEDTATFTKYFNGKDPAGKAAFLNLLSTASGMNAENYLLAELGVDDVGAALALLNTPGAKGDQARNKADEFLKRMNETF